MNKPQDEQQMEMDKLDEQKREPEKKSERETLADLTAPIIEVHTGEPAVHAQKAIRADPEPAPAHPARGGPELAVGAQEQHDNLMLAEMKNRGRAVDQQHVERQTLADTPPMDIPQQTQQQEIELGRDRER